jgi:hypothetical protein
MTTSKDKIDESLQPFDRYDDDLALDRAIELTFALQAKPGASQAAALVDGLEAVLPAPQHLQPGSGRRRAG